MEADGPEEIVKRTREQSKQDDIIAVNVDPTEQIARLSDVVFIMKAGWAYCGQTGETG